MSTACTCNQRIINGSWADCHRYCGWSMSETHQLIFVWLLTSYWCDYNFRVYTWKKKKTNKLTKPGNKNQGLLIALPKLCCH